MLTHALSIATGSSDDIIPISGISGFAGSESQSQSMERSFITFMNAMLPFMKSVIDFEASAIDSKNLSCSQDHIFLMSPAPWIYAFPREEAIPIEMFFNAPPNPAIKCPLKCDSTIREL